MHVEALAQALGSLTVTFETSNAPAKGNNTNVQSGEEANKFTSGGGKKIELAIAGAVRFVASPRHIVPFTIRDRRHVISLIAYLFRSKLFTQEKKKKKKKCSASCR